LFVAVLLLTAFLAAMNGGNDVSKGVATLAGAGVTRYRTAIAWGTVTTLAGCLLSLAVADKLTKLFSSGIVTQTPNAEFTIAVLIATGAWVAFATFTGLPVSTTQALVGALVGAGLLLGHGAVDWEALPEKIVLPTFLAIALAYGISFLLSLIPRRLPECICVSRTAAEPLMAAGGALAFSPGAPEIHVETGTVDECRVHGTGTGRFKVTVDGAHWLSSGSVGFARGLNDAPKIVAVGAFTLVPSGMTSREVLYVVAGAMVVGSLLAGMRVARRLGDDVLDLSHVEGAKANFTTAGLVGAATFGGFPLSTTQVSASAIAGASGRHPARLHRTTLRDFAIAWLVTPLVAGLVAAAAYAFA
jgi:PiT family inorganic phosphate transporter